MNAAICPVNELDEGARSVVEQSRAQVLAEIWVLASHIANACCPVEEQQFSEPSWTALVPASVLVVGLLEALSAHDSVSGRMAS